MNDVFRSRLLQGLRGHLQRPGSALLIVVTLAFGISVTATVGSMAHTVLLRALPFAAPERLVVLGEVLEGDQGTSWISSYPNYLDWKKASRSFSAMAISRPSAPTLRLPSDQIRLHGAAVSEEFFEVLGLRTARGRPLLKSDFYADAEHVVVLSQSLWRQRLGGDPGIVGRVLFLDGVPHTVAGVLSERNVLDHPVVIGEPALLTPLRLSPTDLAASRGSRFLRVIGRLREGTGIERARAEMRAVARALAREYPDTNGKAGIRMAPLTEVAVAEARPVLLSMMGAAALTLLLACANAANILLVQLSARRRDFAVRAAVGSTHWGLFRQLLIETLPLVATAAVLALLLCSWIWSLFVARIPAPTAHITGLALDFRVLAVALPVSLATLVVIDGLPLLELRRLSLMRLLAGHSGQSEARFSRRLREILVAAEVALALTILIGAGLLIESFVRLSRIDLGFRPDNVLAVTLDLSAAAGTEPARAQQLVTDLSARLRRRPGVNAAAVVINLPLREGGNMSTGLGFEPGDFLDWQIDLNGVSPGYFATMGISLLKGRDLQPEDMTESKAVVILSAEAANRLWPGEDPIGRHIALDWMSTEPREVVGVAGSVREAGPEAPPNPQVYLPWPQLFFGSANLVLKASNEPLALAGDMRSEARQLDANIVIPDIVAMEHLLDGKIAMPRTDTRIFSVLASAGLFLAVAGVFGVTAFGVSQRRQEIGLRIALGAQERSVVTLVVKQNLRWIGLGLLFGLGGGSVLTRLLEHLLFETPPRDPLVFGSMALVLAVAGIGATWLPVANTLKGDPARSLHEG